MSFKVLKDKVYDDLRVKDLNVVDINATGNYYIDGEFLLPPGMITQFVGANAPYGWLVCNGQSVSKELYPDLFAVIGTIYGPSTLTNFTLPDFRDRVPVGNSTNYALGNTGGAATHTLSISEIPSHTHTINDPGHSHSYVNNINNQNTDNAFSTETAADDADLQQTTGTSTTGITINSTGGGGAHNNMQPYLVVNYIIKY